VRASLARTLAVPCHYVLALPWRTIGQEGGESAHLRALQRCRAPPRPDCPARSAPPRSPRARQLALRPRRHRAREL